jgi:hypothetical protein
MSERSVGLGAPKLCAVTGETDLKKMLSTLSVQRRDDAVTLVSIEGPIELGNGIEALMMESEGTTVVATLDEAGRRGWPIDFEAAWLTVEAHTSLEAVGLTAAMSKVLTERGIPCNVLAGYYHDHLLVPIERADEAVEVLESLRD